jgi:hypothetical protein
MIDRELTFTNAVGLLMFVFGIMMVIALTSWKTAPPLLLPVSVGLLYVVIGVFFIRKREGD